ncbi:hypothetical protein DNTS_016550 [Danionella cerebrum]|uniref:Conserved oligomeric Golgi complex subunit 2 n=1 Tax=Danionella cerebrum TaxID=2873325 RepID=A0A553R1H6_9TELE|nr:hypothetical protein DNTS_016550 [Danionella translucida]
MMTLPKGPDSLCFDKDDFMKDDFDVDKFVADCRKHVQLEEMREDLEQYYRLLKTAMVELINKDYADFVNLSTNLSLRSSVNEVIEAIDAQLSKQDDIHNKKLCVLRLIQVVRSVEKIEKILYQNTKDATSLETSSPLLAGQILERIATEFNQLQFHAVQSKGMPLLDKVRPRIAGITAMLQQSLEGLLIQGLQTSNIDIVRHCLRTYATIDKTRDAEALVGQVLVKPYMDEVIVEQLVKSNPNGLKMMYAKLLEFVPHHCRLLREVTGGTISSDKADIVPGYDFLVNSVWPEIIRGVDERVPSLFNPGNPDLFYEVNMPCTVSHFVFLYASVQRYTVSMDFVRKFERQCGSQASVKRFKEIAGSLESAIADGLEAAPAGSNFRLRVTETLWSCVCSCWAEQVYIAPLAHRFWKLTLQLISRYSTFLTEVLTKTSPSEPSKDSARPLPSSASSTSSRTSQDADSETAGPTVLSTMQLVFLAADVDKLHDQIPEISEMIRAKLDGIGFQQFAVVSEALQDSRTSLSACVPTLNSRMTQHLIERSARFLKNASEVPRLYRRTNKEVPIRASAYMDNALRPLHQLVTDSKDVLKDSIIQEWLRVTLSECTHRYFETISDVLSSVRKMEESLKRLKQARKTTTTSSVSTNVGPSDDTKIRLQLALDVEYLGEQIQKMGLQTREITMFSSLWDLVQEAKNLAAAEQMGS